jgi:LysR family nitrogen assimilation transcriptional regulator
MTCSLISSGDFPLTHAGEAVRGTLVAFIGDYLRNVRPAGAELLEG